MSYNLFGNNINYNNLSAPHYEIIKVNGEEGAKSFRMAPNSNCFLADSTNTNLIWLAQTDGAGYLTVIPLDVCIHQSQPPVDVNSLAAKVKELEEKLDGINSRLGKQSKKQRKPDTDGTATD